MTKIARLCEQDGFTLLEFLLVLLIVAGCGFVLLLKMPVQNDRRNLAVASTRMLGELRDARQAAMTENTWYSVNFYPEMNSYQVTRAGIRVKDIILPEGVCFLNRPNPDHATFFASGTPEQGTTIYLGTADKREQRSIIVAPVGGRIREK